MNKEHKAYHMLVKNVNVRMLASGDKNFDITLRAINPEDYKDLSYLQNEYEVYIVFVKDDKVSTGQ